MLKFRPAIILLFYIITHVNAFATPPVESQQELSRIKTLKLELYDDLNTGDIQTGMFDDKTELQIAKVQMEIANYYLSQGDRKYAVICAIIARKIFQRLYANPNDPRLIPIYSLLVQIYESSVDIDNPNVDSSDAAKAKQYRQLIDHIHAE